VIKVKKSLSLLIVAFLFLSFLAFAQFATTPTPINDARPEFRDSRGDFDDGFRDKGFDQPDFGREERIIEDLMNRYLRGELSEDDLRKKAKEIFGDRYDELEFKRGMEEFKDRSRRKDTFSYEHEGFRPEYDIGPSYEGYSDEERIFGMVFEIIGDDIDPRDIKQHCNDPNKIADIVIEKFREKAGEVQNFCSKLDKDESDCTERSKQDCSRIGTPFVREDAGELEKIQSIASSCPPNKAAIVEACKSRNKFILDDQLQYIDESCRKRFDFEGDRLLRECERFKQNQDCNKEDFLRRCLGGTQRDDFIPVDNSGRGSVGFLYAEWECYDGYTESHGGQCISQGEWSNDARKTCENHCNPDTGKCGVNSFSVRDECRRGSDTVCPPIALPLCVEGYKLVKHFDQNGCESYDCVFEETACPQDARECPDGSFVSRVGPNCEFEACKKEGNCAYYDRNGVKEEHCANCGNGVCESYEGCTSSSCSEGVCTSDCGGLYCPQDCEPVGCTEDAKICPDGTAVGRIPPDCNFEPCPSNFECTTKSDCGIGTCHDGSTFDQYNCLNNQCVPINYIQDPCYVPCPEPVRPQCPPDSFIEERFDEKGCVFYECKQPECPQVQEPTCNPDSTLETYYDSAGCITDYQCIKNEIACPEIAKPSCGENESITSRYDDSGCVVAFECITITSTSQITGNVIAATYEDVLGNCEHSWLEQERSCSNTPSSCDRNSFIEKCKEQERLHYSDSDFRNRDNCELESEAELRHVEQRCSRMEEDKQRCFEDSKRRCEEKTGLAQKCTGTLTEENLRKFIVREAEIRCKFGDIIEDEDDVRGADKVEIVLAVLNTATQDDITKLELFIDDLHEELRLQDTTVYKGIISPSSFGDIKLLPFVANAKISTFASSDRSREVKTEIVAGHKVREAAGKLASLRDSDVPNEYLYIIEDKAGDVLDVSDELEAIEKKEDDKGIGYKLRLLLGLAKAAEREEINQLTSSKEKLSDSISTLTNLIDEVPSDVAKAILREQVDNLKSQLDEIEVLIEVKQKKAKGLFGIFG
jgi:hypothetical protein|tara:strand:- start:30141 stop:33269 length:3129 start_codon:yes stop_codon:yes gene_type:complete